MNAKNHSFPDEICHCGIEELDLLLKGGLPRNRLYLVQGRSGAGKTTLAMQFLLEGQSHGEQGLYIALSETKEELLQVAHSHGWSIDSIALLELSALGQQLELEAQNTVFKTAEMELPQTIKLLLGEIDRINPSRIVLDSLSELRLLAQDPLRYRRQLLALKYFFAGKKCTVLFLDDAASPGDLEVESIAHGVIRLEMLFPGYGPEKRRLKIDKLRGVQFLGGYHDYKIQKGGIVVFPRLIATQRTFPFKDEVISSGIAELDELLGGGLDRGTSTLIVGPAGTGKSSIASRFAFTAAAQRHEKVLIFTFEESLRNYVKRTSGLNLDFNPYVQSGQVHIQQVDPAELSPGEMVYEIHRSVQSGQIKMVVIDSLNGYLKAMPEENFLTIQLHELLTYLNQRGVTTLMTLAQRGIIGDMASPVDITYLSDNVIALRYFEASGRIKKAISVVKKRTGHHEDQIREFRVETGGIRVGQPLKEFQGILSGEPTFLGSPELMMRSADEFTQ